MSTSIRYFWQPIGLNFPELIMVALCTFAQILLSILSLISSQRLGDCWGWGVKIKWHVKKKKDSLSGTSHWRVGAQLELQLSGFNWLKFITQGIKVLSRNQTSLVFRSSTQRLGSDDLWWSKWQVHPLIIINQPCFDMSKLALDKETLISKLFFFFKLWKSL